MVDFRPFNGVRYDASAGSLAGLVCPPYDVISPRQEQELLARCELSQIYEGLRHRYPSAPAPPGRQC